MSKAEKRLANLKDMVEIMLKIVEAKQDLLIKTEETPAMYQELDILSANATVLDFILEEINR